MSPLKDAMNMMTGEIATLTKQHSITTDLLAEIKQFKCQNMEQEKKIALLENQVLDLKQYTTTILLFQGRRSNYITTLNYFINSYTFHLSYGILRNLVK